MGVGPAAAALTVGLAVATPTLSWHLSPVLLLLAALTAWRPHWAWTGLGAAAIWSGAGQPWLAVIGVVAAVATRRSAALALIAVVVVVAAKQGVAVRVLPAALDVVPALIVTAGSAAGGLALARGTRAEAVALAIAGGVVLLRLGMVFPLDGEARLGAAARIDAVGLVYDDLVASDPALARALVRAAPDRDAAAALLPVDLALDAGWRPARAEGRVIEVARALEARGRGGEALRLLRRHPREGDVDWLRGLFERTQGEPVRWRGAVLEPTLPGRFATDGPDEARGWDAVELTATAELGAITLVGEGEGLLGVRLDGGEERTWRPTDGELVIAGPLAAGPHRLLVHRLGAPPGARIREVNGR